MLLQKQAKVCRDVGRRDGAVPCSLKPITRVINAVRPIQKSNSFQTHVAKPTNVSAPVSTKSPASRVTTAAASATPSAAPKQTAVLLMQCPDQKGVIAATSQLLYGLGCNIESSDQFSDTDTNMFFQRIAFDYSDLVVGPGNVQILEKAISELARKFNMTWKISYKQQRKRMAVLVSKLDHCLYDLLIRQKSGEMNCDIPIIISNHPGEPRQGH